MLAGMSRDGFQGDPVVDCFVPETTTFVQAVFGARSVGHLAESIIYRQDGHAPAFSPFLSRPSSGVKQVCQAGVGPILAAEALAAELDSDFASLQDFFIDGMNWHIAIAPHWIEILSDYTVVALSTTFVLKFETLRGMVDALKAQGKRVILGGVLVNKLSDQSLETLPFDYCLKTEAEGRLRIILDHCAGKTAALDTIPGLLWREGGVVRKSLANFSLVDFGSASVLPSVRWITDRGGIVQYESVRGCPFRCEFCDYPYLMGNKSFRIKPAEQIFEEWSELYKRGARHIDALDSLFTVPKKRAVKLAELLISSGLSEQLTWACYARANELANPDFALLLRRSGCRYVFLGIESGSQVILDNMRKLTKVSDNAKAIQNCENVGLYSSSSILIGFPGETEETIADTKAFLRAQSSPSVHVFIWIPDFTEGSPVPIMQPDRIDRFRISGKVGPATYRKPVWGKPVDFHLRTVWTHSSMTQERALEHALDIGHLARTGSVQGEDFSFAPYRALLKHPSVLASRMTNEHQTQFAIGMKYVFDNYINGYPIPIVADQFLDCLDKAGLEIVEPLQEYQCNILDS